MSHNSSFHDLVVQLDTGLANDNGFDDPFRVHYFKPFTDEMYQTILEHLPNDEYYEYLAHIDATQPDGTSTRLALVLSDERIQSLPEHQKKFWREMMDVFNGPALREVFRKHLAPELTARFNAPIDEIPLHASPMLLRDLAGYKIRPHPDTPAKVCTIQIYLPSDDSDSHLGTSFYRRLPDGSFELLRTLEYKRNTGYCFTVTDNSWHGTVFGNFTKPRNSLMLTYFVKPIRPIDLLGGTQQVESMKQKRLVAT